MWGWAEAQLVPSALGRHSPAPVGSCTQWDLFGQGPSSALTRQLPVPLPGPHLGLLRMRACSSPGQGPLPA